MGPQVQIIDSGAAQARKFLDYLERHPEIEKNLSQNGTRLFFTTDDPERFAKLGSKFLGQKISRKKVEKIELE
jgi:glutamate racemase